jgi:hypothetical protein
MNGDEYEKTVWFRLMGDFRNNSSKANKEELEEKLIELENEETEAR